MSRFVAPRRHDLYPSTVSSPFFGWPVTTMSPWISSEEARTKRLRASSSDCLFDRRMPTDLASAGETICTYTVDFTQMDAADFVMPLLLIECLVTEPKGPNI